MKTKKKILIIDDEKDILSYFETFFQDNGFDTIIATDGLEGYMLAKLKKPDLITLDITMPDQSGIKTYYQYKNDPNLNNIPIIIITAVYNSLKKFLKDIHGLPKPEGFMTKPIILTELIEKVNNILNI